MTDDKRPAHRRTFVPKNQPEERWGLLTPAAIVVAVLLIGALLFVRSTGA